MVDLAFLTKTNKHLNVGARLLGLEKDVKMVRSCLAEIWQSTCQAGFSKKLFTCPEELEIYNFPM